VRDTSETGCDLRRRSCAPDEEGAPRCGRVINKVRIGEGGGGGREGGKSGD